MKPLRMVSVAALALVAACSDSGGPGDNPSAGVAFAGTFASDARSGTLVFATAPAALRGPVQASLSAPIELVGTLDFDDGSSLDLAGTLDGAALLLAATGYQFTGTLSGGVISGTFSGPNGESGSFAASLSSSGGAVALYCGTYDGDDAGVFSLALKPDRTGGVIVVPSSGAGGLTGRSRAKSGTTDEIEVVPDAAPTFVIASGTLSAIGATAFDSVDGAWDDGNGNAGTFGGSTRCQ
jgi:hypothetical protein